MLTEAILEPRVMNFSAPESEDAAPGKNFLDICFSADYFHNRWAAVASLNTGRLVYPPSSMLPEAIPARSP